MSFRYRVLQAGYFPKELPPPFGTQTFADFARANPRYIKDPWKPFHKNKGYVTKLVRHHLAEVGRNRRVLSIPNPINQLRLVQAIESGFQTVFSTAGKSAISASKPNFHESGPRAISPRRDFSTMPKLKANARAAARFILRADVTRFYPSIYTHSIAWALHTKDVAKADRGPNLVGNVIDRVIREAQDGQTIGVPIGPDTSLVIGEIILSAVDEEVSDAGPAFRWYDDYELSGLTRGDCESGLVTLEQALARFELEVNIAKTAIEELPSPIEDEWANTLRDFQFRPGIPDQFKDLNSFFSRAFDFSSRFARKPVLRYAVRKLHGAKIHPANWLHVQRLMAQAATHEPEVLPHVLGCLNYYSLHDYPLDRVLLGKLLESILQQFAARAIGSEVAWSVWGFMQFNMAVPSRCVRAAMSLDDDVVNLLLLDARSRGQVEHGEQLSALGRVVGAQAFEDDHWLLSYEGIRRGWLKPKGQGVAAFRANTHVAALLGAGVTFYNNKWRRDATARHIYGTPPWLWYQLPPLEDEDPLGA